MTTTSRGCGAGYDKVARACLSAIGPKRKCSSASVRSASEGKADIRLRKHLRGLGRHGVLMQHGGVALVQKSKNPASGVTDAGFANAPQVRPLQAPIGSRDRPGLRRMEGKAVARCKIFRRFDT
jgi:hypothetical protein